MILHVECCDLMSLVCRPQKLMISNTSYRKYSHPLRTPQVVLPKRKSRDVGTTVDSSTQETMSSTGRLESALERRLRVTPFARMVFIFR